LFGRGDDEEDARDQRRTGDGMVGLKKNNITIFKKTFATTFYSTKMGGGGGGAALLLCRFATMRRHKKKIKFYSFD
jgi:hypothetical protein